MIHSYLSNIYTNFTSAIFAPLRKINQLAFSKALCNSIKKVKDIVFFWRSSPFVRPKDHQSVFDQIKARYINIETKSLIEPLRGRASDLDLGDQLLTNGENATQKESHPVQKLRVFARNFVMKIIDCTADLKSSDDAKRSLEAVKPLIPALTDIVTEITGDVIQNISFPNTIDGTLNYVAAETRAHVAAQEATEKERDRIDQLKSVISIYNTDIENDAESPTYTKQDYDNAIKALKEITNAGKEPLLREIYAKAYDDAISAGNNDEIAKEKARKARMESAQIVKKPNLVPELTERCREFYFRDFYFTVFSGQGGTTNVVSKIATEQGIDVKGMQNRDFNALIDRMADKLADKVFEIFEEVIEDAALPKEFLLKYLKPEAANRLDTVKKESMRQIIRPLLFEATAKAVRMWIVPELLNEQLAFNILPPIEDQLLKVYCKFIVQANWNVMAPLFYAYDVAGEEQKKAIAEKIKEKLFTLLPTKYGVSFPADMPKERFNESADMMIASFQEDQSFIRQTLQFQVKTAEYQSMIDAFYDIAVTAPAMPAEEARTKKRTEALASIKSYMFTMIPDAYRKNNENLLQDQTAELQLETFHANLSPLIEKIEKRLAILQPQIAAAQDKKSVVKKGVMDALSDEPMESNPVFGDLVFDIGLKFGKVAPRLEYWSSWLRPLQASIKRKISESSTAGIQPFRSSHHELVNSVVDGLEKKLSNEQGNDLDKAKVNDMVFVPKPRPPNVNGQLAKEIQVLSKLSFGLAMEVPPMLGYGERGTDWIQWAIKKTVTGDNSTHVENVVSKVHDAYFNNRFINLSRIERIVDLLLTNLHDAQKQIARKKSSRHVDNTTKLSLVE